MKANQYNGDIKFLQAVLSQEWQCGCCVEWDDDAMSLVCSVKIPPIDISVSGVGFDEAQDEIMVRVASKMESLIRDEFKRWEARIRKDCVAAAKQEIAALKALIADHDKKGKK